MYMNEEIHATVLISYVLKNEHLLSIMFRG